MTAIEDDLTLSQRIAKARVMHSFLPDDDDRSKNEFVADELEAAGFRRQGPITETQVELASEAFGGITSARWEDATSWEKEEVRTGMWRALKAARDTP